MKKYCLLFVLVFFTISVYAEKQEREVNVTYQHKDLKIEYSIAFNPEYKINMKAPFNFFLLDSNKKQISKVEWNLFYKDETGVFKYVSDKNEKYVKYWFVACRYIKDEVVACKTFAETIETK